MKSMSVTMNNMSVTGAPAPTTNKCYVYWDYENCPSPVHTSLHNVVSVLKRRIWKSLGQEICIEFKLYISSYKVSSLLRKEFDLNGIKHFEIPSNKPESVDKRMLVDVPLDLYNWKGVTRNAIAIISGDSDFAHIMSRIHKLPEISKLLLIQLPRDSRYKSYLYMNPNLLQAVDEVLNDFSVDDFEHCEQSSKCKDRNCHRSSAKPTQLHCSHANAPKYQQDTTCNRKRASVCLFGAKCNREKCRFVHPGEAAYAGRPVNTNIKWAPASNMNKRKRKRKYYSLKHCDQHQSTKRRKIGNDAPMAAPWKSKIVSNHGDERIADSDLEIFTPTPTSTSPDAQSAGDPPTNVTSL